MLSLKQIQEQYPAYLQSKHRFLIREYLQCKILEIIFSSHYAHKLSFLGGTCLRLIHGNTRFSEDLDFDNFNLSIDDFKQITSVIKKEMEYLGYVVTIKHAGKDAYRCIINFPELLYNEGLSGYKQETFFIQFDTQSQGFEYQCQQEIINKFDVFTQINSTPSALLLAQKFYTVINRKRSKGRDFFDIVFLLGQGIKPDYSYLDAKMDVKDSHWLRDKIIQKCSALDMKAMADDVKPFLFDSKDEKKIELFLQYIKQAKLA